MPLLTGMGAPYVPDVVAADVTATKARARAARRELRLIAEGGRCYLEMSAAEAGPFLRSIRASFSIAAFAIRSSHSVRTV